MCIRDSFYPLTQNNINFYELQLLPISTYFTHLPTPIHQRKEEALNLLVLRFDSPFDQHIVFVEQMLLILLRVFWCILIEFLGCSVCLFLLPSIRINFLYPPAKKRKDSYARICVISNSFFLIWPMQCWLTSLCFRYMILATTTVAMFVKYIFYVSDMLMEGQWEKKAVCTFYLELIRDLLHLSMYLCFFMVIFV